MNEVFKMFQINVSETCGASFSESEIHLMAYLGMPSEIGNFFKPSYNNYSFPLQRLMDHHSQDFRFFYECYDDEGYLPIHRAVQGGNTDAVEWFLKLGVDMWRKTKSGWTSLDLAIYHLVPERFENKDIRIKHYMYSALADLYLGGHVHHSPLFFCYFDIGGVYDLFEHVDIVRNIRKKVNDKLFEKAFKTTNHKSSSLLQSWCQKDSTELSPLHIAASLGMEMLHDIHKKLQSVSNRYSLSCCNKHNIQPLYLAYLYDSVEAAENLRIIFLQNDNVAELTKKHPIALKYPDREAEYHLIYNYFYKTPDEEVVSKFDFSRLFQCKGINDFLPGMESLHKKIGRCYKRCKKSVLTASNLFFSTSSHVSVEPLLGFDIFNDFFDFSAHLGEIRYQALNMFYEIPSKLWRHVSKAYECSYQCSCAEAKLQLLKLFTSEPREDREIGQFVAERMGWSNTSLDDHWPFSFLLNKALRKDRIYDYLKIFGNNFIPRKYGASHQSTG